ncbi:hypothetical protein AXF42_Ash001357 [Apostasia shenzhenica]|uniref:DNA repair RAD52-like protein 2, chloroplastic n=1 Tax=Apostasia shenzhenica TaxID=1088818 RepID=A0A2I0AUN3_9ASPA|nr:hypothetical protein AXF42_Ash001357 [Apostasia shenzhenica]
METASSAIFGGSLLLPTASPASLRWGRVRFLGGRRGWIAASLETGSGGGSNGKKIGVPNSNYVVPLDMAAPGLIRPLNEILRDLNKRVPDKIIDPDNNSIPWYHANRMLSFYAPGWCGEVRSVIFSDDGTATVVYRVTIRGSDGELLMQAHRESTGTVSTNDGQYENPVTAAEEIAFCRACARFGFGLYLYHEDESG